MGWRAPVALSSRSDLLDAKPPGRAASAANRWLADTVAGLTVVLVLIPQGIAYAELAGMPPHRGLFAAALPPLLAGFFGSSPYLQTGPVALTSLLTFGALSTLAVPGSAEYVELGLLLAMVVGVTRLLVGVLRWGAIAYWLSQPVLCGFTLGAALLIFASQLPACLGVGVEGQSVLLRAGQALGQPGHWEAFSLGLSVLTIGLMYGGRRVHPLFPGVLLAVVMATTWSAWSGYQGPTLGAVPRTTLPPFSLNLAWHRLGEVAAAGVVIALVGFAEVASISQALAERGRQRWDPNREFVAQGVANMAAGLTGAFPVGGSFSRSAVNRLAGAQTTMSGSITGALALCFLPFAFLLSPLPKAVLGATVLGAVLKLMNPRPMWTLVRQSVLQGVVALITFSLTLALAPHVENAILIGMAVSLGVHMYREQQVRVEARFADGQLLLRPVGVLWFGSAPIVRERMVYELSMRPDARKVEIDLGAVGRVDLTGAMALQQVVEGADETPGLMVSIVAVPKHAERVLGQVLPGRWCPAPREA